MMLLEELNLDNDDSEAFDTHESLDPKSNPEIQQIVQQYLENHYRQTLDERIPVLDNKTPRQCAKSAKGRKKLITWLKTLENHESKRNDGQAPFDFTWMWDELGLDRDHNN